MKVAVRISVTFESGEVRDGFWMRDVGVPLRVNQSMPESLINVETITQSQLAAAIQDSIPELVSREGAEEIIIEG